VLTTNDVAFFARNGFVHLPKIISDDAIDHMVKETWKRLPPSWSRSDPTTWTGVVEDDCHSSGLDYRRGHVKFQRGSLPSDAVIDRTFNGGGSVAEYGKVLLGQDVAKMRVRGLYPNIKPPNVELLDPYSEPHLESHPVQLVLTTYLSDVSQQDCGALLVWPGSHRDFYPAFKSKLEFLPADNFEYLFKKWKNLQPVELCGSKGDIILIHHRLLNSPSLNRSEKIRFAFLCDYFIPGYRDLCCQPPSSQFWEDWSPALAKADQQNGIESDFLLLPKKVRNTKSFQPKAEDHSTTNQSEATELAYQRIEGDIWLMVSDEPKCLEGNGIRPYGRQIKSPASVRINGKSVASVTSNDVVVKNPFGKNENIITVQASTKCLYVKIVKVALPFSESRVLARGKIDALNFGEFKLKL
jgi:hypothetical protein